MFLPEEICEKHGLKPFFVCNILLAMRRVLQAKRDFDIEHWENYYNELSDEELSKRIEEIEALIETPEGQKKLLKNIEEKRNTAERQFSKLAESIKYWTIPKAYLTRIAKQEDITWENFLSILKEENPELDIEKFTEDCRKYFSRNSNPQMQKLLKNYQW